MRIVIIHFRINRGHPIKKDNSFMQINVYAPAANKLK